ncbi:unnamed protein product, partial [marine sediment metagenome]
MAPQNYTELLTVGDVSRILTIGHGTSPDSTIGQKLCETELQWGKETQVPEPNMVRLNLQNPYHSNVFQYLTVFDPVYDFIDNDADGLGTDDNGDGLLDVDEIDPDELKIPGRININTAPWYVIAQLPWMTEPIAQAIVAYRDKLAIPVDYRDPPPTDPPTGRYNAIIADPCNSHFAANFPPGAVREEPGFASIGELNFVIASTIAGINIASVKYGNDSFLQ